MYSTADNANIDHDPRQMASAFQDNERQSIGGALSKTEIIKAEQQQLM